MVESLRQSAARQFRHRVGPWIDRLAERLGQPTTRVYPSGYVGTVHRSLAELETELRDGGFTWDPISMYHYTLAGSTTDGSWMYRTSPLGDRQIHVVLFEHPPERVDVYAHEEFSWLRHPLKHAREVDIRRRKAVAEVRRWLASRGIDYERDSLPRRTVRHAAKHETANE